MIKKSILILAFTFLFTACAERGAVLVDKTSNGYTGVTAEKSSVAPKLLVSHAAEERVKNTLSGSLVFIIALIILL